MFEVPAYVMHGIVSILGTFNDGRENFEIGRKF
jgi:hypothetical protein